MKENWKDIKGFEGLYQVSNLGRVKSLPRERKHSRGDCYYLTSEKIIKPYTSQDGFLIAMLRKNKKYYKKGVHILVFQHFRQDIDFGRKRGLKLTFVDGDKKNCAEYNLKLETRRTLQGEVFRNKSNSTSKYPGVAWNTNARKWKASIQIGSKCIHLGYFEDETEAAAVYQEAKQKLEKQEFAKLRKNQ